MKDVRKENLKTIGGGFGAYPGMEKDIYALQPFWNGFFKGFYDGIKSVWGD